MSCTVSSEDTNAAGELVRLRFQLPAGKYDDADLSNAVWEAGISDAVVGTGETGVLAIEFDMPGGVRNAADEITDRLLERLPKGAVRISCSCEDEFGFEGPQKLG